MIINSYVFSSLYDPDAQAFISAASITNTTQQVAINNLVLNLKSYGIWNKMKAIYPMVGGTASSHKWNLKDPRDLDIAFRLSFVGGWTHSSTGAKPGGVNGYADTFLTSSTTLSQNSTHISYYSRTDSTNTEVEIGTASGPNIGDNGSLIEIRTSGTTYFRINSQGTYITSSDSNSKGWYIANRTASNVIVGWRNNYNVVTGNTTSSGLSTRTFWLGGFNSNGAQYYSTKECAFATIGDGLTNADITNLYISIETYQTALSRNVGVPIVSDSDAQAFLNAADITNTTQANAVNQLVIDLKAANLWTKMKAVYPFVGGTATTHKWNLKNPSDTNAAFRLSFVGGWTHSANGALSNGTNAYADTFLSPISVMTPFSLSIGSYNKDATGTTGYISGCQTATSQTLRHQILTGFHALRTPNLNSTNVAYVAGGFNGGSRVSSTLAYAMNSAGTTTSDTGSTTNSFPTAQLALACLMNITSPGSYSSSTFSFYSAGDGLSIAEMTTLRTIVINFQTTLGRV